MGRALHHERELPAYASLQSENNLYDREEYESRPEGEWVREALGVGAYSSPASGFLTGQHRPEADWEGRARARRVRGYLNARRCRLLTALDRVATARRGPAPARTNRAGPADRAP